MKQANGWHHHERVYIQARHDGDVLVQYVDRLMIPRKRMPDEGWAGPTVVREATHDWAWVPDEDVMPFSDLDATLLKVWKVA